MLTVQPFLDHFSEVWFNSTESLPSFAKSYNETEKLEKEQYFEQVQQKLEGLQKKVNLKKIRSQKPELSFFPVFRTFLQSVFDFEEEQLDIILSEEFRDVSKKFFYQAREFGPDLSPENIYQGLRNVWIMNGLQLMMQLPVEITPSVFAYSMIYPYSDNLLDDPTIPETQKKEFSKRFNCRLHGEIVKPGNFAEGQLFRLVEMFENQYDRNSYSEVYESLYLIQEAQTESLKLINSNSLCEMETGSLCFAKGGASVLADGFLVAGNLTGQQQQALFGYGVYLQLLDDIQDINEDLKNNSKTMCSSLKGSELGRFVNRTIHFGRISLDEMRCFQSGQTEVFLNLMNRSIETMIIESVGLNNMVFDNGYLSLLEQFSPLHFEFIRSRKSHSRSQRFALFKKYFEQAKPSMMNSFS